MTHHMFRGSSQPRLYAFVWTPVCESTQPGPPRTWSRHGGDPGPWHLQAPSEHEIPRRTTAGAITPPTWKRRRAPDDGHPEATVGSSDDEPAGSTSSRLSQSRLSPGPRDPRAPTPCKGPDRARGARPRQAAEPEWASAHPSTQPWTTRTFFKSLVFIFILVT